MTIFIFRVSYPLSLLFFFFVFFVDLFLFGGDKEDYISKINTPVVYNFSLSKKRLLVFQPKSARKDFREEEEEEEEEEELE